MNSPLFVLLTHLSTLMRCGMNNQVVFVFLVTYSPLRTFLTHMTNHVTSMSCKPAFFVEPTNSHLFFLSITRNEQNITNFLLTLHQN